MWDTGMTVKKTPNQNPQTKTPLLILLFMKNAQITKWVGPVGMLGQARLESQVLHE